MIAVPKLNELTVALAGELSLGGFEFAQPFVLAGLLLPLLLLLIAKSKVRPLQRATSSLRLWRRLNESQPIASASSRASIPPTLWLFTVALASAAMAASQPRMQRTSAGRTWQVVVDRSPSMFLNMLPAHPYSELNVLGEPSRIDRDLCPVTPPGSALRIEVALDAALVVLSDAWRAGDQLTYSSPGRVPFESDRLEAPPAQWLSPDLWPSARPEFDSFDAAGYLLVTDRALPIQRANLFASGGAEATGLIGRRGNQQLLWRGGEVLDELAVPPRFAIAPVSGLGAVGELFKVWCSTRGFELTHAPSAVESSQPALVLSPTSFNSVETRTVEVGREGWKLRVELRSNSTAFDSVQSLRNVWLTAAGQGLVSWRPGQISIEWAATSNAELGRPTGDPASFALSWSKLFDEAVLPEPRSASLVERQAAGNRSYSKVLTNAASEANPHSMRFDIWLAIIAASFAFLGAWRLGTD
ncbi:MAG: hypothetical protein ACI8TQ_000754 [Planctomycetota bacterium]|jgi:hypothetical protein